VIILRRKLLPLFERKKQGEGHLLLILKPWTLSLQMLLAVEEFDWFKFKKNKVNNSVFNT
jgi:hypothetical protein